MELKVLIIILAWTKTEHFYVIETETFCKLCWPII